MPGTREKSKSYAGRQVDLELLKHVEDPAGYVRAMEVVPEVAPVPRIVAGIEKAVQRYASLFLTNVGSVHADSSVGNSLLDEVFRGRVSTQSTLDHLVAVADSDTLDTILLEDGDGSFGDVPDDERIVSSEVLDARLVYDSILGGRVKVRIGITTAAGESFTFIVPVEAGIS